VQIFSCALGCTLPLTVFTIFWQFGRAIVIAVMIIKGCIIREIHAASALLQLPAEPRDTETPTTWGTC
jgi:hypothetical protein